MGHCEAGVQGFRELKVWQKTHELVRSIYRATLVFPRREMYGITSQLRRCTASVVGNLAEGRRRQSHRDFARFVGIALGSAGETAYFLLLAHDLGYVGTDQYTPLARQAEEVRRMLTALHARLLRNDLEQQRPTNEGRQPANAAAR